MVETLLTEKQKNSIVEVVQTQCRRFQDLEEQGLFYEPYTEMRKKHIATSAVISGFAPGRLNIEGITVRDLYYGLKDKMAQPELQCNNGAFHIYSNGSDLKGEIILERCREMNQDITIVPVFFLIIVTMNKDGVLSRIDIKLPNANGVIVEELCIYQKEHLAAAIA